MMKRMLKKFKVKSICLLLLVVFLTGVLSGCWSSMEIDVVSFISAIGIDRAGPQEILVSFQIIVPRAMAKEAGGQGEALIVTSVKARDLSEAYAKLAEMSPRAVRLKQLSAVILGEELAKEGSAHYLDFFARHWEVRGSLWLLMAKGRAQDILLQGRPVQERIPATAIKNILGRRPLWTTIPLVTLSDFLSALAVAGKEPIAASIEVCPMREQTVDGYTTEEGALAEGRSAEEIDQLAFRGAGVFCGDKLLDFLDPRETRGMLWLQGEVQGGIIHVPIDQDWAAVPISRVSAKVKPQAVKDKIRFLVEIEERGFV